MRYCLKLAPFLLIGVQSFVPTVSFRKSRLAQLLSNGPIEYNDFDFVVGGDGDAGGEDYETRALQQRVAEFRSQEVEKDTHLSKNWRQGNWKVQGFALDKHDPADDTAAQIHISKVIVGAEADSIVVGRTDGSVCVVEMGTEYCTRFVSKLKATAGVNDTVSFESEMVRLDDQIDETIMRGAPKRERDLTETTEIPFEVSHQFMAHDQSAITALHTTESETGNVVVTGSKNGQITIWNVPDDQDEKVTPVRNLEAHSDEVVAIEAVSMTDDDEPHLLLSVSIDGSLALWDIWTGDSIYQCEMMSDDGDQQLPILCAAANSKEVFLGLANGEVVVYSIPDMVECASMGGTCPVPNGKFMAQAGGVTAIQCAGEGTLAASSRSNTASSVLLTGGKDGVVKQWEIIARGAGDGAPLRFEHWPRLANQRMQRRAHLFQGHPGTPVTAIASVDSSKFISAGADGSVRAWSPAKGTELFRMDGFTKDITSICLDDTLLITNGMEHYVCIHDFDIAIDEFEDGYEMEW